MQGYLAPMTPISVSQKISRHREQPGHIHRRRFVPFLPSDTKYVRSQFFSHLRIIHASPHKTEYARVRIPMQRNERRFPLGKHNPPLSIRNPKPKPWLTV